MALVSTITQSTSDSLYKEIPRDYFVTRGQKINKKYALEGGEEYMILKSEILKEINDNLKTMMILKSQKIGLQVIDKKSEISRIVQSYKDIGLAWKSDDSIECAAKINTIMNNTFTENSGYEYYLETKIMKKFKLQYIEDTCIKGSIARMIVTRKCELAKVINKRAERAHQKKIL